MSRSITESGTIAPLESNDGTSQSDHRTAYCRFQMKKMKTFTWQKFTYRHYNEASVEQFKHWVVLHDWTEVLSKEGSNGKADAYQKTLTEALERFFPLKTTRRKSTEHPWMNKKVKKMIKDKKDLFWEEGGRTAVWKERKRVVADAVRERKKGYMETQKPHT